MISYSELISGWSLTIYDSLFHCRFYDHLGLLYVIIVVMKFQLMNQTIRIESRILTQYRTSQELTMCS